MTEVTDRAERDVQRTSEEGDRGSDSPEKPVEVETRHRGGFFCHDRIFGPVTNDYGDSASLACSLVTGMVDAASFANWSVFCGMQTGNTVISGLSTATLPQNPHAWESTLISIASYLIGAFFTFRLTFWFMPAGALSNRFYISSLFLLQGSLVILAAGLATPQDSIPHNPPGETSETIIHRVISNVRIVSLSPPSAFQSGMQIAVSRLSGFNESPVNVLTSTYCDSMGDPKLLAVHNVKRNRRFASAVSSSAGAIISGWLMRSSGGSYSVLYSAGGIKVSTAVSVFLFFKRKVVDDAK